MAKPTKAQLNKINQLAHAELTEDQVYVFESLCADTLPVTRYGWFGEYTINMTPKMLQGLKKDYQKGTALLASHDSRRLPIGRTFDAYVREDEVNGEMVKTLYVDHYIVTHAKGDNGDTRQIQTETGMTTQAIADSIDAGFIFDTSIGFSIDEPICSICGNPINDYSKCEHIPGMFYEVDGSEDKVRCNIVADNGEGIENSLVYAGAVNRATIQNNKSDNEQSFSLQQSVSEDKQAFYTVDDIKNVPLGAKLFFSYSRGVMEIYTNTPNRNNFTEYMKGCEQMANEENVVVDENLSISREQYDKDVQALNEQLAAKDGEIESYKAQLDEVNEKLSQANTEIEGLKAKAQEADSFRKDLVEDTVKAGIAARGNHFNAERYESYLNSLSNDEIKVERDMFKAEFSGAVKEAQQVSVEVQELSKEQETIAMTYQEMKAEAARIAMAKYQKSGGNLIEMTHEELEKLQKAAGK